MPSTSSSELVSHWLGAPGLHLCWALTPSSFSRELCGLETSGLPQKHFTNRAITTAPWLWVLTACVMPLVILVSFKDLTFPDPQRRQKNKVTW